MPVRLLATKCAVLRLRLWGCVGRSQAGAEASLAVSRYTSRLYPHLRDGDLPAGATALVPPWWKEGDGVVASDAAVTAARDVTVSVPPSLAGYFFW
eukprot:5351304-Amphidinium_carterae.1